ncbi:MAG: hypothetical protein IPI59_04480 [Sphingobacteriales bacterium]|nr:hypothetical protein [Sphingobacteriales bacterium]MBP9142334.1 hypothetical protein [Chitinophagales bacterium]MDA0199553.1 hypothetical protein [Bacteroidota bacterium]MBK6891360.1 hypothetical protein [Sphingobacteriales bacterium]MBK7526808.1 hypothetical protein [Sphingobacteriales bacterium]
MFKQIEILIYDKTIFIRIKICAQYRRFKFNIRKMLKKQTGQQYPDKKLMYVNSQK